MLHSITNDSSESPDSSIPTVIILPGKYKRDAVRARRRQIRNLMSRGISSSETLAGQLGVSDRTVRRDQAFIRKEDAEKLSKVGGKKHVAELLEYYHRVIESAFDSCDLCHSDTPTGNLAKARFHNVILATLEQKTALLVSIGLLPGSVGAGVRPPENGPESPDTAGRLAEDMPEAKADPEARLRLIAGIERLDNVQPEVLAMLQTYKTKILTGGKA